MTEIESFYKKVGQSISGAQESQMFGKPCFKVNGKAFISLFDNQMVFKLSGDMHTEALSLDGSEMFDPSKKNRPMKEWVKVPYHYKDVWGQFAEAAFKYVEENSVKK
jgi:hypothetical protein